MYIRLTWVNIVLVAVAGELTIGFSWKLLYSDELMVIARSHTELQYKHEA